MTVQVTSDGLSLLERHALDLLVDLSRLPRTDGLPAGTTAIGPATGSVNGIQVVDGRVMVDRCIITETAALITLAAERESTARDPRGRVPAAANALVASGREKEPVIQHHAAALRRAVSDARGGMPRLLAPWPGGARWAVALTHDLDLVRWWGLAYLARSVELLRRREWRRWRQATSAAVSAVGKDPVRAAIDRILAVENSAGIRSTWFVMAGTPSVRRLVAGDVTYSVGAARALIGRIQENGHEVGLHGSFATATSAAALRQERDALVAVAGPVSVTRQHFLRMEPLLTQARAAAEGLLVDSTAGFFDRSGFRIGVADLVPLVDGSGTALGINEAPLVWMDRAGSKYRGIEAPDAWVDEAMARATTVERVEGLWVGLWHPNLAAPFGYPGAEQAFADLVARLSAGRPWFATLGQVSAWRERRRNLRVVSIDDHGVPVLVDPNGVRVDDALDERE